MKSQTTINDSFSKKWNKKIDELKKIIDNENVPIDSEILETIAALNLSGFPTVKSCAGHTSLRTLTFPFILGWAPNKPKSRYPNDYQIRKTFAQSGPPDELELNPDAVIKYNAYIAEKHQKETKEYQSWCKQNLILRQKIRSLLSQFYSTRKSQTNTKFYLTQESFGYLLMTSKMKIIRKMRAEHPKANTISTAHREIAEGQNEIKAFTSFLIKRLKEEHKQNSVFFQLNKAINSTKSLQENLRSLRNAVEQGAKFITISRPTTANKVALETILKECINLDIQKISVETDGQGFCDKDFANRVLEGNQNIIKTSLFLHGPNKYIHDKVSQGSNDFDSAIKAIKNIIRQNCELTIIMAISKANCNFLIEHLNLLKSLKVKNSTLWFINPPGEKVDPRYQITNIRKLTPLIENAVDFANSLGIHLGLVFFPFCLFDPFYLNNTIESHFIGELRDKEALFLQGEKSKECQHCRHFLLCPGIWKKFYHLYGFQFKPSY